MKRAIMSIVWLLLVGGLSGQQLRFYKENITMQIGDGYFYVSGNYYLRGDSAAKRLLMYPFPVDVCYGEVDSVYVFDLSAGEMIAFDRIENKMIVFPIHFTEGAELELKISYRQQLHSNRAEYILETTKTWRRPLDQADFQLIVPNNKRITRFSYPPDSSISGQKEKVYFWTKTNFMPAQNMIFKFEERKE